MSISETFLDGRVIARQPDTGFRSGLDAVMLAAAVQARQGDMVLELGTGAGTASLCLLARVPGIEVTGVEIDPALTALAKANAAVNRFSAQFVTADIFALPQNLKRDFDRVLCNPPFHDQDNSPPDAARARALMDKGTLAGWLRICLQRTVSNGIFTTIIRADRLDEGLAALGGKGVRVLPLWPKAQLPAKRVIVEVHKGSRTPLQLLPGLVLHREDGAWTPEAEAVLRRGEALALTYP